MRITVALLFAAIVLACGRSALAQTPEEVAPEIRGVLVNSQTVLDRLQTVMKLTGAKDQQQYATLKDFIDVFLIGVDVNKPVRLDVLTGGKETTYRLDVPVAQGQFRNFWKLNLVPLGIPVQEFVRQPGLYKLGGNPAAAFTGFMLYDPQKRGGYATIVEESKHLPAPNAAAPTQGVQDLLNAGFDAAVSLRNKPEGIDIRAKHYAGERESVLGKLKKDVDESASDFELRKFAAGVQFDQSQRLYAEAENLLVGLKTGDNPAQATASVQLKPLPDTPLAEAIAVLGQKPSRFAGVPRGDGKTGATGRINYPFDDFRKKNFLALAKKIRENRLEEMAHLEGATPEQRQAGQQFLNGFFDQIEKGIEAGVIDGFVEMTKGDDGVYTVVGGIKSVDGADWVPVLELVPQMRGGPDFTANTAEHAGVALHEITLNAAERPEFVELFGSERLIVGTGPDTVWYAAGPAADERLRQAIDQASQEGQADPAFISFRGELLPGLRILDRRLGTSGRDDLRDMAIEALREGGGILGVELNQREGKVQGAMTLDSGILRIVGKALAKFSRENLAE